MINKKICIILLLLWIYGITTAVSIYDIQFTTSAGSGTYPSPYVNQVVSTEGIVVARGYGGNSGFFLSMPEGGAWKGLFVYNSSNQPNPGDQVSVTGTVVEYYGWTEINNVSAFSTLSTGNAIPPVTLISTAQLNTEAYESVFVEVQDVQVTQILNSYNEWYVSDGSQDALIAGGFFDQAGISNQIQMGNIFSSIKGLINFSYNNYRLNPRSTNDLIQSSENISLSFPNLQVSLGANVSIPLIASNISADNNFTSYGFTMYYNPELLSYGSYSSSGTLSQNGSIGIGNQPGILEVSCTLSNPLQGMGELLKFNFSTLQAGHSTLVAQNFHFNGNPISSVLPGSVRIDAGSNLVGDTLTIIQHPILNIPEIVIPGELMTITCLAPESTTGWQATLKHGSKSISLPVLSSQYVLSPNRWLLSTQIPNVPVFELYNLEVTANGGIQDLTRNAVQVVPSRKSSYYFVHVTDTHMPGRTFYPDAGYQTDSTSVMDFRAVLEDINIIRPEFVLLTGDLINEGELEDFAGLNSYGWAQKVLSELEVPVYLTSGNHDIGGWDSTPAPQGSARRNWWRYFGWNWLDNPDYSWGNHHQDYSFTYGNTHYIGLESYDNYDSWRYMIYGAQSYTPNQLAWLSGQLNLFPGYRKVLFHHYDFSSQLNLNTLGIDMALWGHIHSNSGSISTYPYDLATRSTCDGNRAYRVIKVTETNLQPLTTIYAGSTGSTISQTFHPNNYGLVDSVRAVVYNGQNISFDNALVKFKMPGGNANYTVSNGSLEQVDRSGLYNICYVKINLPASSNLQVSIKANDTSTGDTDLVPPLEYKLVAFPNPFTSSVYFSLTGKGGPQPRIEIYNLKGQKLSSLELSAKEISWTPQNLASGIYFVKLLDGTKVLETRKITFINR